MTRLSMTLATFLIAIGSAPALAVPGGSIDCDHAASADEKTICADPELIQRDYQMTRLYKAAAVAAGMGSRGDIKDEQAVWLGKRRACDADASCLREAYASRIVKLKTLIKELDSHE